MRPAVVPPLCPPPMPTAPTPNSVMSFRIAWRSNRPSSRPARICEPSLNPTVKYTWRISICAPAWVPPLPQNTAEKLSWQLPPFWICGANPKCTPKFRPASLPFASNVANAGSNPVRMLEFAASPAAVFSFVNTQKTFTFPENEKDHPLDICIVRPCAPAVAETPSAKPNNNSVRRFIRDSLLGSLPGQSYRSCPRGANCNYTAPGIAEWERGPPTSNTRLASHLQLCEQTGESGAHLLESESIVLSPAPPGRPHQAAPASARHSPLPRDQGGPAGVAAKDGFVTEPETAKRTHIPAAPWPGTPQNIR